MKFEGELDENLLTFRQDQAPLDFELHAWVYLHTKLPGWSIGESEIMVSVQKGTHKCPKQY